MDSCYQLIKKLYTRQKKKKGKRKKLIHNKYKCPN
jgi:hypothetical protein